MYGLQVEQPVLQKSARAAAFLAFPRRLATPENSNFLKAVQVPPVKTIYSCPAYEIKNALQYTSTHFRQRQRAATTRADSLCSVKHPSLEPFLLEAGVNPVFDWKPHVPWLAFSSAQVLPHWRLVWRALPDEAALIVVKLFDLALCHEAKQQQSRRS